MAGEVIEFDPSKRLSKEAFQEIQTYIAGLKYEEIQSLCLIMNPFDGRTSVQAYGLDFYAVGAAQAILNVLSQHLLEEEFEDVF